MRIAGIDCGTNSIRLLIADVVDGTLTDVVREMRIVRLGEGVDATGEFSAAALQRTLAACDEYADLIATHRAATVRFVATSASRDVSNRAAFVDGVVARLGVEPQVISGETEALLSFTGALRSLPESAWEAPALVVDIGGGSTEFVLGDLTHGVQASRSVDIGCVRMTERRLRSDPPTQAEIQAATADIDEAIALAGQTVDLSAARSLIGLAGSVTTVSALAHGLTQYDSELIHGSVLSAEHVHRVAEELLSAPRSERAASPVMHPGRVDVIGGGALVLDRIVAAVPEITEVIVSEHDILDGIAWAAAGEIDLD